MNVLKVKKGETLARKQDKVMEWYLIQEGTEASGTVSVCQSAEKMHAFT